MTELLLEELLRALTDKAEGRPILTGDEVAQAIRSCRCRCAECQAEEDDVSWE